MSLIKTKTNVIKTVKKKKPVINKTNWNTTYDYLYNLDCFEFHMGEDEPKDEETEETIRKHEKLMENIFLTLSSANNFAQSSAVTKIDKEYNALQREYFYRFMLENKANPKVFAKARDAKHNNKKPEEVKKIFSKTTKNTSLTNNVPSSQNQLRQANLVQTNQNRTQQNGGYGLSRRPANLLTRVQQVNPWQRYRTKFLQEIPPQTGGNVLRAAVNTQGGVNKYPQTNFANSGQKENRAQNHQNVYPPLRKKPLGKQK